MIEDLVSFGNDFATFSEFLILLAIFLLTLFVFACCIAYLVDVMRRHYGED